ncbi:UDP-glucose flavonoid 3-O-glucosyltransferase 7-like [Lolium rigidum]|uniref:UDP-glucose flavonoid 3-O-glucosyltransferase 7-like n=1 Tax=Lolium rigidum TaxID=89674 RepID=UPI001F5DF9C3|nr:UDP-glucose flavonoid 3-O-glucosyltransferase 7-like [Lolium rigidum]
MSLSRSNPCTSSSSRTSPRGTSFRRRTWPRYSVVYVSFGTLTSFSLAEHREIARGLDLSGKNFVWVLSGSDDDRSEWMPEGFAELTGNNDRGFLIQGWAPRALIPSQPAVSAGVPMVTWPRYADQFYNEKLVVDVLKVGVSVGAKDYASSMETHEVISGEVIAGSITRLMGGSLESDNIRKKAEELRVKARTAVETGGGSYNDVGRLMDELMAGRSAVRGNANLHGSDSSPAIPIDISVVPFPDVGLPPGFENVRYITQSHGPEYYGKFLHAGLLLREPFDQFLADSRPRVDAVVTDSFFTWSQDAAAAHGVPRLVFLGISVFARCCSESTLRNNPLEACPDDDEDPDAFVLLPGLPHRVELRRRQILDHGKRPLEWEFYESASAADQRSFGEVFNSFHELEPDYVEHFHATLGRRAWLVGPVALATDSRDVAATGGISTDGVADICLRWLDTKLAGSVVYVSFGTLTTFLPAELVEIARGLDLSGKNFLWVISGTESSEWMPQGFAELLARGDRGFVIRGWAPQTLILKHLALGGFVTHCGWNSVLEAVSAGVPMVTWPRYGDQFHNEKLVVEVLKVGVNVGARDSAAAIDTHEVIGGEVISASIKRLMDDSEESNAMRKKIQELRTMATKALEKGGSSYNDVGRVMDELMARRSCKSVEENVRAS